MKATFDTNALDRAARPERHPKDPRQPDFIRLHEAIKAGRLKGYFSETIVTLEGIENKDRVDVLGHTQLSTEIQSAEENTIHINVTPRQNRKPLHHEVFARIEAARKIGMRALRGPARPGWIRINDVDGSFFEPDRSEEGLSERLDRASRVASAIEARGVGFVVVKSLAAYFSERDRADVAANQEKAFALVEEMLARAGLHAPRIPVEEPWFTSLLRAKDIHEERQVQRAIAEWADADSVAAHVGYGIDFFCTEDEGKTGGASSVLDAANRAWLQATYSVKFVTLSGLAEMI
jgi:hypothetical protein